MMRSHKRSLARSRRPENIMPVVLFFDIGNTNIKLGLGGSGRVLTSYSFPTNESQTSDQFGLTLLEALRHGLGKLEAEGSLEHSSGKSPAEDKTDTPVDRVEACVAASVVPGMTQLVAAACLRFLGKKLLLAPEDIAIPLENNYARPHEVGADRLVGAYAARRLYPSASSIISVDYGTATTIDCVEGDAYLGGLICPGVMSSVSALSTKTAKLPRVNLVVEEERPVPGRSTFTSLNHGFVFGFAAMTEGLCEKLAAQLKAPVTVIGTGGFARAMSRVTGCFDAVRPDLLLEGLAMLYEEHKAAGKSV